MMDDLKTFGTPYFQQMFRKRKPKPKMEYSTTRIPIGRKANGQIFYLDIKEACRVSIIASTGGGKTWLMRGMMDRLNPVGYASVFLADIKGELISSVRPIQPKFQHLLLPGEKPKALPLISLRPTFFKAITSELPRGNIWYSVDMRRMTQREFMTFMNVKSMTPTQKTLMEIIYQEMRKEFDENDEATFSLDFIEQVIDSIDEIDTRSNNAIKLKFRPLKESKFHVPEFEKSIIGGLQRRLVPAINLTDFESFGKDNFDFPTVTMSIVLREIITGRRNKEVGGLWIFIDEATRFCGNDKDNSFKHEILEAVDVERRFGTSMVFCWQSMIDIPEKILFQSRYIFVPGTENVKTLKDLLNNTGTARNVQSAPGMATRLKRQCKNRPYAWIVFDRKLQTMEVIDPLAPLSNHMEAGD